MDITNLAAQDTFFVHLRHPGTDEPLYENKKPVGITVYGPGSSVHRQIAHERQNEILQRKHKKGKPTITAEQLSEVEVEGLKRLTVEVANLEINGEKITPENVDTVYGDSRYRWLADQVNEGAGDWGNFIKDA